ncbi:cryptochrome/photolyase family protein [Salisaeta longa]|uniref:cryptochrome/photolyase family protein n=1 Tax=Salisaeta longa TaxID=503170 RepID=UPI0003B3E4D9
MRTLALVLRDQLDRDAALFDRLDPSQDALCITEGAFDGREHKQRLVLGLAALRAFRTDLERDGWTVHYAPVESAAARPAPAFLRDQIARHEPARVVWTEPSDYALNEALKEACAAEECPHTVVPDAHFLVSHETFNAWASDRKTLTMEYFYREQRRAHEVLLTDAGDPVGGEWNYDSDNRESFGREGPGLVPNGPSFAYGDTPLAEAQQAVEAHFADAPGACEKFQWPVTPAQAEQALDDFITNRLPTFGTYQDAMWTERPFLYHSRLAAALNLKLLAPMDAIRRAEAAYTADEAPLNAVEGFIRQILGWREYVRGVYWRHMPEYATRNALDATRPLPALYWTGDTDMTCLQQCTTQVLTHGYAHHIQRLMVLGLFALLYGADPNAFNAWHEQMYVDAWPWVSVPNALGMSQFADGGLMGSKPYTASGKYINRMSNYCTQCRFNPDAATGDDACPFTTLYWDFLDRHADRLSNNHRMNFQLANLRRKSDEERAAIRERASVVQEKLQDG